MYGSPNGQHRPNPLVRRLLHAHGRSHHQVVPAVANMEPTATPPPPDVLLTPVSAVPPSPPTWTESLTEATTQVQSPFIRTPVPESSAEHREIARLFGSELTRLWRIVNPELWKRFTRARADLLTSKSDDLSLLGGLGLSEEEIAQKAHVAHNFDSSHLNGSTYSDNVVLLFHGSKGGEGAMDKILSQGLDERLGSGGTFGRGIYFSDDPQKAMDYDRSGILLVCLVMLGDCLVLSPERGGRVREPEKTAQEKRNHQDLFFDSIVGFRSGGENEYVVFNRAYCYPLYVITYGREALLGRLRRVHGHATFPLILRIRARRRALAAARHARRPNTSVEDDQEQDQDEFKAARRLLPSFAWIDYEDDDDAGVAGTRSPFYATTIFNAMTMTTTPGANAGADGNATRGAEAVTSFQHQDQDEEQGSENGAATIALKLAQLDDLGFQDRDENERLLRMYDFDLELTIDNLVKAAAAYAVTDNSMATVDNDTINVDMDASERQPQPAQSSDDREECLICADEYPNAATTTVNVSPRSSPIRRFFGGWLRGGDRGEPGPNSYWETLPCTHKMCTTCADRLRTTGTTMSGARHTFLKCPFCQHASGIQIGDCPNGIMDVAYHRRPAAGYESYGSISVRYQVQDDGGRRGHHGHKQSRHRLDRTAYLPANPEGQRVLELLRLAWDRRLVFTIGTSMTTGASNVLVWNIHHKTALDGGASRHGYPDPGYLLRVQQELAQYGIQ